MGGAHNMGLIQAQKAPRRKIKRRSEVGARVDVDVNIISAPNGHVKSPAVWSVDVETGSSFEWNVIKTTQGCSTHDATPPISQIIRHASSSIGMTDSRDWRTSAM